MRTFIAALVILGSYVALGNLLVLHTTILFDPADALYFLMGLFGVVWNLCALFLLTFAFAPLVFPRLFGYQAHVPAEG